MAFTGTATVVRVSDNLVRITGLSLATSADGTIGLSSGHGVDLVMPNWLPYGDVTLIAAIQVVTTPVTDVAGYDEALRITKAGTTQADFAITITNDDGDVATPELEIYVRFH